MPELYAVWSSNATTGGQTPVEVTGDVTHSVWLFKTSSGVSTAYAIAQSGFSSAGPWADEGGSTTLTSNVCASIRVVGPLKWIRPYFGSTGMSVRVIGVR